MANLPPSFSLKFGAFTGASSSNDRMLSPTEQLVLDICDPELREKAIYELAQKREIFHDLAPILWHSVGTIPALLQEILLAYPLLSPPTMTAAQSNRVRNTLTLFQCVAIHPETRMRFLEAELPMYLYAFLNTSSKSSPFEYLRQTSLGVIGALVKGDDTEVIKYFLKTEIVPLCFRTMENGGDLTKTVATFIVQRVLLDNVGLEYMCITAERFFVLVGVLGSMITSLAEEPSPSPRLLRHIIRCYLRLTDNLRACDALENCLPDSLRDATFSSCLYDDPTARQWLQQLLHNVGIGSQAP